MLLMYMKCTQFGMRNHKSAHLHIRTSAHPHIRKSANPHIRALGLENWVYSKKIGVLKTRLVILLAENKPKGLHPVNGYIDSWAIIVGQ
jgi:hypothetical protein